jgi:hypothetical protein
MNRLCCILGLLVVCVFAGQAQGDTYGPGDYTLTGANLSVQGAWANTPTWLYYQYTGLDRGSDQPVLWTYTYVFANSAVNGSSSGGGISNFVIQTSNNLTSADVSDFKFASLGKSALMSVTQFDSVKNQLLNALGTASIYNGYTIGTFDQYGEGSGSDYYGIKLNKDAPGSFGADQFAVAVQFTTDRVPSWGSALASDGSAGGQGKNAAIDSGMYVMDPAQWDLASYGGTPLYTDRVVVPDSGSVTGGVGGESVPEPSVFVALFGLVGMGLVFSGRKCWKRG